MTVAGTPNLRNILIKLAWNGRWQNHSESFTHLWNHIWITLGFVLCIYWGRGLNNTHPSWDVHASLERNLGNVGTGIIVFANVQANNNDKSSGEDDSLLVLQCLTTSHAFYWDRAYAFGKGTTRHTRNLIKTEDKTSTCVNQCVTLDPGYRALHDYWQRRRQEPFLNPFCREKVTLRLQGSRVTKTYLVIQVAIGFVLSNFQIN